MAELGVAIDRSKHHNKRQRQRQSAERTARVLALGERLLPQVHEPVLGLCGSQAEVRVDWSSVPASVDPVHSGQISAERGRRKRWQIESFRCILDAIVGDEALCVVDFCCGSGNFGLALAALLPKCSFLLLDRNAHAIDLARQRAADAGLSNVSVVVGNVEDYEGKFDVALAMHACGNASDYAQAQAIRCGASYVLAPCCVGKLKASGGAKPPGPGRTVALTHPRSEAMRLACSHEEFMALASFADHEAGVCQAGSTSKTLIEHDRASHARECGWVTLAGRMEPESASAKCDPPPSAALTRAFLLSTTQCGECASPAFTAAVDTGGSPGGPGGIPGGSSGGSLGGSTGLSVAPPLPPAAPPVTEMPAVVQCSFFIARRQRTCRLPATGTGLSAMCADHADAKQLEVKAQVEGRLGIVLGGNTDNSLLVQFGEEDDKEEDREEKGEGGNDGDEAGEPAEVGGGERNSVSSGSVLVSVARSEAVLARTFLKAWIAPPSAEATAHPRKGARPNPLALHNLRGDVSNTALDACCSMLGVCRLHVDLSCGDGRYVAQAAAADPSRSWLGLDAHASPPLAAEGAARCAYLCCNCHQLGILERLLDRLALRGLSLCSVSVVLPQTWLKVNTRMLKGKKCKKCDSIAYFLSLF
ncbi:hypothetical protein T492DRAFT_938097 [Pavlovales sp. CCMP2436]|nr:hypothetical protein T492DRAFT_938097 [Pavlovales sp. CCMP2436]